MILSPAESIAPAKEVVAAPVAAKLAVRHLNVFYGEQQALFDISMDVPARQITAIIGPSGCGKSTLLRVLNRMYDAGAGERVTGAVSLDGEDVLGPQVNLRALRGRIGMVFQEATMFPMSIFDNIAFGVRLAAGLSHAEITHRVEAALTRAALWAEVKDRLSDRAGALSGGQQQRLCIARALAVRPEVLLLDEPTGALDPASMQAVEALIMELKRDLTIVLVTHNMNQAKRCADRVAFFYLGRLVEEGPTEQVFHAPLEVQTKNYLAGKFG